MSGKILGAILILVGSVATCLRLSREMRQEMHLLQELACALEGIESAIRWQKLPLPRALRQQAERPLCGDFFNAVLQGLKGEIPLQQVWTKTAEKIHSKEAADILGGVEWTGDETQIIGSLHAAVEALRRALQQRQHEQRQREKLRTALTFSAAALLIIVLM